MVDQTTVATFLLVQLSLICSYALILTFWWQPTQLLGIYGNSVKERDASENARKVWKHHSWLETNECESYCCIKNLLQQIFWTWFSRSFSRVISSVSRHIPTLASAKRQLLIFSSVFMKLTWWLRLQIHGRSMWNHANSFSDLWHTVEEDHLYRSGGTVNFDHLLPWTAWQVYWQCQASLLSPENAPCCYHCRVLGDLHPITEELKQSTQTVPWIQQVLCWRKTKEKRKKLEVLTLQKQVWYFISKNQPGLRCSDPLRLCWLATL